MEFGGGPRDLFLLIADGMGGHAAGEVASALVVSTFAENFLESVTTSDAGRLWDCLEEANRRLAIEIQAGGQEVAGMGTTLLAVLLRDQTVRWMSVGDSPLYLIREEEFIALNRIHSKATELADQVLAGLITEEQARLDPSRHTLMSAIIGDVIYEVDDPSPVTVKSGDILVAATDGIETLTHAEIKTVVISAFQDDAAAIADALIFLTNWLIRYVTKKQGDRDLQFICHRLILFGNGGCDGPHGIVNALLSERGSDSN
jgi:protein phosphatase